MNPQASFIQKRLIADEALIRMILVPLHVMSKVTFRYALAAKSTNDVFGIVEIDEGALVRSI